MIIAVILKEVERNDEKFQLVLSASSLEEIALIKSKKILEDEKVFPIIGYADVKDVTEIIAKKLVRVQLIDKERVKKRFAFLSSLKTRDNDNSKEDIPHYYCYQENEYFHVSALKSFQSALRLLKNPQFITIQKIYDTDLDYLELYSESKSEQ